MASRMESPAGRPTDSLICLKRSISSTITVGRTDVVGCATGQRGVEPVEEQPAVRQAGEVVVHGVVQDALLRGLTSVTSASVPTTRITSPSEPMTGRAFSAYQ